LRDQRRDQRYPVSFAADMFVGRTQQDVLVRDLSKNGAMLSGTDLPPEGTRVLVALGAAKLFGTVVWNHDGYCGLSLIEPIEPLQVVRDMARAQARREEIARQDKSAPPRPAS
jgi:hypothetical protein